jgi:hypothetical protein
MSEIVAPLGIRTIATDTGPNKSRFASEEGHPASQGGHSSEDISKRADAALPGLEKWFETMRNERGYGGPVVHWWQQSMMYTGAGLDWRYEGIIAGYLKLWEKTRQLPWLDKAIRAGNELLRGQRPDAHFRSSGFEINPSTAGTPHEAACDIALLLLARSLKDLDDPRWKRYLECARANLEMYYLARLWDDDILAFADSTTGKAFVPNKAATAAEAMLLMAEITGDARWAELYGIPTVARIVKLQVTDKGPLDGAIAQNSFGELTVDKYFPLYISRCIPALLKVYALTGGDYYLTSAIHAMAFIERWSDEDGSLPTAVYANGRASSHPSWLAPLGDILRAADLLRSHGYDTEFSATRERFFGSQDTSGGFQTATGFAGQASGRRSQLPDARDLLHVAGWCDKSFRYLAGHVTRDFKPVSLTGTFESDCTFRGKHFQMVETPEVLEFWRRGHVRYRWRKGALTPEIATEEFWLR